MSARYLDRLRDLSALSACELNAKFDSFSGAVPEKSKKICAGDELTKPTKVGTPDFAPVITPARPDEKSDEKGTDPQLTKLTKPPQSTFVSFVSPPTACKKSFFSEEAANTAPPLHPANRERAEIYLRHIDETDPVSIAGFLDGLARHSDRLAWLYAECIRLGIATPAVQAMETGRQAGEIARRILADDDRRTCRACGNLATNGRCMAAGRGELPMTTPRYAPDPDRLLRCVGFAPTDDDSDPRPGRERWPNLYRRLWAAMEGGR